MNDITDTLTTSVLINRDACVCNVDAFHFCKFLLLWHLLPSVFSMLFTFIRVKNFTIVKSISVLCVLVSRPLLSLLLLLLFLLRKMELII